MSSSNFNDVVLFQLTYQLPCSDVPRHPATALGRHRIKHMQEELDEFAEGLDEHNLAKMADALIDLVYVAMGTAAAMGLPWQALWDEVHRANMSKTRGVSDVRKYHTDVIKPPGWVPPDIGGVLAAAGYDRDVHNRPEHYIHD